MSLKRIIFTLLLILFLLSLMDDLSKQSNEVDEKPSEILTTIEAGIAHVKIKPGDTILSVTEKLNNMDNLDVQQITADFKQLNPGTDIDSLIPYSFYYFPLYNE